MAAAHAQLAGHGYAVREARASAPGDDQSPEGPWDWVSDAATWCECSECACNSVHKDAYNMELFVKRWQDRTIWPWHCRWGLAFFLHGSWWQRKWFKLQVLGVQIEVENSVFACRELLAAPAVVTCAPCNYSTLSCVMIIFCTFDGNWRLGQRSNSRWHGIVYANVTCLIPGCHHRWLLWLWRCSAHRPGRAPKQNGWNEHVGCDSDNEDALFGCALRDGEEMAM